MESSTANQNSASEVVEGCEPAKCGKNSGVVPFHKDAVHASLLWKERAKCPQMLIWMRPSEYKPSDYLNPTVTEGVFPGFWPPYTLHVQGNFAQSNLDRSGWSRYAPDLERENTQLIDVCGLQKVVDTGVFKKTNIADLDNDDLSLTEPYFRDAGYSRGLGQNLFCAGHTVGIDGQIMVLGGHDKGGNNGLRKISVFDPEKRKWDKRPIPCVKTDFEKDPTGEKPAEHCDPLNEANTDPKADGDMTYQRWYPTGVTLPDGRVLILSGTDQDTSQGPGQPTNITKVRQKVPEVYNPWKDKTIALDNAQKLLPMYVRSFVTQTGPGWNDWKVCTTAEAEPPFPGLPPFPPSVPPVQDIGEYDPFYYNGNTYCLDVLGALADPNRTKPGENHWKFVAKANASHDSGAGVRMVTINPDGTWSQKVFLFGGDGGGDLGNTSTAEMIDFSDPAPTWKKIDDLTMAVQQNNAVVLPDGNILVVGGRGGGVDNLQYQMYNSENGKRTDVITSPVPRHDHSTLLVVPNGGVWVMGGNRTDLLPEAQTDQSVPVMEFYQPPYFFKGERPKIKRAPHKIHYGDNFKIKVDESCDIASVALLRTGPVTHNWSWGNQYVKLPVIHKKNGKLLVKAPPLPGLAVGGDYMLFVVDKEGIPSKGKHVRLEFNKWHDHDRECDGEDDGDDHDD
ncbi:MAG TPA: galactose oxidase-like domain-containing protein [Labilithrix sp.]|nr:galactose oxidase-like domain-containing protein [Labilithrix sp.]